MSEASLSGAAGALFREPTILLQPGWAPAQIRAGDRTRWDSVAQAVVYVADRDAVLPLEEVLAALGAPIKEGLRLAFGSPPGGPQP